jgi:hypothetical protein
MHEQAEHESGKSQLDKFKEAARELECDEDEAAFEDKLKKIARTAPPKDGEQSEKDKPA